MAEPCAKIRQFIWPKTAVANKYHYFFVGAVLENAPAICCVGIVNITPDKPIIIKFIHDHELKPGQAFIMCRKLNPGWGFGFAGRVLFPEAGIYKVKAIAGVRKIK